MGRFKISLALVLALCCVVAPAAVAAPGELTFEGCQSSPEGPAEPGCTALDGLSYTGALALSLDGKSAYASRPGGLSVFSRNADGELTFIECFSGTGDPACAPIPHTFRTPVDIALPHDGRSVYVAGGTSGPLLGFSRNAGDGRLTLVWCESSSYGADGDPPGCPTGGYQEANQVEASSDGRSIYLADRGCTDNTGECFAGVGMYRRDPLTSLLTSTGGGSPATAGGDGRFAVTPKTGTVYGLDHQWGTISVFKRIRTEDLKRTQCLWPRAQAFAGPCKKARKMGRAKAIAVSPAGHTVVTVVNPKRGKSWLTLFDRARNGKLSFERRVFDKRLRSVSDLQFANDGRTLLVASGAGEDSFLLRFQVSPKKGGAKLAQCLSSAKRKGCAHIPQLRGLTEIAAREPDVYAVVADGNLDTGLNAVLRFDLAR
jgi:hypothetical protein